MKKTYEERNAELHYDQIIQFESESITVDIPLEGVTVEGGWKIKPQGRPVVRLSFMHVNSEVLKSYELLLW